MSPISTFLNGRPYTQLRGAAWLALSENAQLLSGTVVDDSGGGGTTTWNAGGTIPCRITPLGSREELSGGRISDRSTHVVYLPQDTTINVAQRLDITGRGTYEITGVRERTSEMIRSVEVVPL